ncbi:hypothetical protein IMG5_076270 [Ichthyophthirius multifiliis]|uniref:GDP-Man:Man(3)GlcNAc(2)-PP-Dol alpha-1,2-mannosyltransferase n=1 Tax=Ichthyophthirius multifiliis TaxID=5932 RepID=G0QQ96_ICHMU|nr:hypothetical protein IMG5_076270 [Ichthyophthirius multifiliis]EGR32597.1 hypothetical protein IMG5_076270 [Ichthyophthirius multifiliis]|eukprot:XP_004036583.1 hypothetical protein IMG5_076270 [Ichthyophthirius multifiliis]
MQIIFKQQKIKNSFFTSILVLQKQIYFLFFLIKQKSNAAGGGEKVLYCIIKSIFNLNLSKDLFEIVIYSCEQEQGNNILQKAKDRFNLDLLQYQDQIKFIKVPFRFLLEPFSFATLFFQVIGILIYTYICLFKYPPDIFYDTTGLSFSYFIVKKMSYSKVISYVHYPFISQDMINDVLKNNQSFNNRGIFANWRILKNLKIIYYIILVKFYKKMGSYADLIFTNSSWTDNHIKKLWKNQKTIKLYPPCNIKDLILLQKNQKNIQIMSFAQFRPEKNHLLQINIINKVFKRFDDFQKKNIIFKIVGSTRNQNDIQLLQNLKNQIKDFNLVQNVHFIENPQYTQVIQLLQESTIGLHTMKDEHFGISVVEMMAAGLVVLSHNSAGPKMDIIQNNSFGFLCENEEEYIEKLLYVINNQSIRNNIVKNARQKIMVFSDEQFIEKCKNYFKDFLELKI